MRRFAFKRRPRVNFRRARRVVRAVSGITIAKRIILGGVTIPDITSVDWDNPLDVGLVVAGDTVDEELESDGTNVAQVPNYSRLTGMKLELKILGSTSVTNVYRWYLYKKPDGESLRTSLQGVAFHSSDDTPTERELRKMCVAKGMAISNPSSAVTQLRVFVRRKAWARISPMRENDRLTLLIAKDAGGTTSLLHGFGTVYARANG